MERKGLEQSGHMLNLKVAQKIPKVAQKVTTVVKHELC